MKFIIKNDKLFLQFEYHGKIYNMEYVMHMGKKHDLTKKILKICSKKKILKRINDSKILKEFENTPLKCNLLSVCVDSIDEISINNYEVELKIPIRVRAKMRHVKTRQEIYDYVKIY